MQVGVVVPQGLQGEYEGWDPIVAWRRTVEVAVRAERLGFESIWVIDHFHTIHRPSYDPTFESFSGLSALAALTSRVRLGHIVVCTAYRNPALTAKMISTLDTISGGRAELGLGAGWKRDEWEAYGWEFPNTNARLARLADDLEVITRMLDGGTDAVATYEGPHARVVGAVNSPKPIQRPRLPILIGGNGPNVTWRLAARFADELNLDGLRPDEVAAGLPVIRQRCEEIGRDPSTLRVSVHVWREQLGEDRTRWIDALTAYRELGVSRVMSFRPAYAESDEAIAWLAGVARDAGAELDSAT